ncbi:hypothetical protein [uncultured Parasphingopyxis sp.]|uniref:LpxL/LpxP family acyltransferase n=1 Tax=uncultured Parasphingopyxis sp. TaxID=1547918 RepID=UPI0026306FE4|nr:hypothetical protein [uncultured Parasphingopyxis sp.]
MNRTPRASFAPTVRPLGRDPEEIDPEFDRMMQVAGVERDDFLALLDRPYDAVTAIVREAAAGRPAYPFMAVQEIDDSALRAMIEDEPDADALAARRILTDRIMQLYLLRALSAMPDAEFDTRVSVTGADLVQDALAAGEGVLLLNSHIGPGRLVPLIVARLGWQVTSLAPHDFLPMIGVDCGDRIDVVALAGNAGLAPLGAARQALQAGGIVTTTGDGLRGRGKDVYPFLESERPFTDSFAFLSIASGARCLPVFMHCEEDGAIAMDICPAIETGDPAAPVRERIEAMTRDYIDILEQRWLSDFTNLPARSVAMYNREFRGRRKQDS